MDGSDSSPLLSSFTVIKSTAFNATYFVCCLHFSLMPFTSSIRHKIFEDSPIGKRSERHLLEIHPNSDFVQYPCGIPFQHERTFALTKKTPEPLLDAGPAFNRPKPSKIIDSSMGNGWNNGNNDKQRCNVCDECQGQPMHSVVYDPISAHFFPCGYDQNLTM